VIGGRQSQAVADSAAPKPDHKLGCLAALLPEVFFQGLTKHVGFSGSSSQLCQPPPCAHLGRAESVPAASFPVVK